MIRLILRALALVALTWAAAPISLSSSFPFPGPGRAEFSGGPSFFSLAASDWGTAGTQTNLTGRVPIFENQDDLPLSTSGWATITPSACTGAAFSAAVGAVAVEGTVIDFGESGANCDVVPFNAAVDGASQEFDVFLWPNELTTIKKRIVVRGKTTGTIFRADYQNNLRFYVPVAEEGLNTKLIVTGNAITPPSTITSWAWTGGFGFGEQVHLSGDPITNVYPGDILWLTSNDFAGQGADMDLRLWREVVCAQWDDGTVHGSDCAGVDVNNEFRVKQPLKIDMGTGGPYPWSSALAGRTIHHVERVGGGTLTRNLYHNIGFERIRFENEYDFAVRDFKPALQLSHCVGCWFVDGGVTNWGATHVNIDQSAFGLIRGNDFTGGVWKPSCVADLTALTQTKPAQATVSSSSGCSGAWEGTGQVVTTVWFPDDHPEPELAGQVEYFVTLSDNGTTAVIELPGVDCSDSDGSACATNPGGYAVPHNQYGSGSIYLGASATGWVIENNRFQNVRNAILQQGGHENVVAYNECHSEPEHHSSRCIFDHAGTAAGLLVEGNVSNGMAFVPYAGANSNRDGQAVHQTWFRNQGIDSSLWTSYGGMGDQCQTGMLCPEHTSQTGAATAFTNWLGNVIDGIPGSFLLDECDNNQNGGAKPGTCESPYQLLSAFFGGNLWFEDVDANFEPDTNNATTINPDVEADDLSEGVTELPPALKGRVYPTSLYRTAAPAWWSGSADPFPGVGADLYSPATPGCIPAMVRRYGGPCPRIGTFYVATTGSNANPGTLASPWLTISYAMSQAQPGDTINVGSGNYSERVVVPSSGTFEHRITLQEQAGQTAILDGSGVSMSADQGLLDINGKSFITIKGLEVRDSTYNGIRVNGESHHVLIDGVAALANGYSGIYLDGPDAVPAFTKVLNSTASTNGRGGITLAKSAGGYFEIAGNTVENNTGTDNYDGIQVGSGDGATHHVLVRANTVSGNGSASGNDNIDAGGHGIAHHYLIEQNNISGAESTGGRFKLHSGSEDAGSYTPNVSGFSIARFNRLTGIGFTTYGYPNPIALYNNTFFNVGQAFEIYGQTATLQSLGDATYVADSDKGRFVGKNNLIFQDVDPTANYVMLTAGPGTFDLGYDSIRLRNNIYRLHADQRIAWTATYGPPVDSTAFTNYKASNSPDLPDTGSTLSTETSAQIFDDTASNEYCLDPTGDATNAATHLTTAVGAGTNASLLTVDRASMFADGYCAAGECLRVGDLIRIGTGSAVRILYVNDRTNVLKLESTRTWVDGDPVTLSTLFSDPDVGGGVCL